MDVLPTLKLTLPLMTGSNVKLMQMRLKRYGIEVEVNSQFDFDAQAALQRFQKDRLLKPTGICDADCWRELLKED